MPSIGRNIITQTATEALKPEAPKTEAPKTEAPKTDAPTTGGAILDRDDQANQADSNLHLEHVADAKAENVKAEQTQSNKEAFTARQSTEVVKSDVQRISETVKTSLETHEPQSERVEQVSFEALAKALEKLKDKKTEETKSKAETAKEEPKLGKSLKELENTATTADPEQMIGSARKRDDGEVQENSNRVLNEQNEQENIEGENEIRREVTTHQSREAQHKASEQMIERDLAMKEKLSEKSVESAVHARVSAEETGKEAVKTESGNTESGDGDNDGFNEQEEMRKAKELENEQDSMGAETGEAVKKAAELHDLKLKALEKAKEKEEPKDPQEIMRQFQELIGKMPDSQMSQDDKQKAAQEFDQFINSDDISKDLRNSLMSFVQNQSVQKGLYQETETAEPQAKTTVNLTGPLKGITLNMETSISRGGMVKNVNEISLKPNPDIDISVKVVTQTSPTGITKIVGDPLFGSAIELKIKPGTTQEQFNTMIDGAIGKILAAFVDNSNVSVDRDSLKAMLGTAFNKVSENLGKIVGDSQEPVGIRVPISQTATGELQSGNILVEVKPRLTLV
jgi:hypothetical protein